MKILWSEFAIEMLMEIHNYYKVKANPAIARKIKTEILNAARQLKGNPDSGQIELTLEKLKEGHRYLVRGNYKIVYKVVPEGLLVTDVFDTRQDPVKLIDNKSKTDG